MRKVILVLVLLAAASPSTARADTALGVFVGQPFGLDLKLGMGRRNALDIVVGASDYRDGALNYVHLTYLVTVARGHGDGVLIPLRLGIGGAILGFDNDIDVAARVPLQLGLRFRSKIELYGEIALKLTFIDDDRGAFADLDGGIGLRFYF
jgi:hypothetical protein